MSEEIEWLDEELTNLTAELTEQLKELTSRTGKKLSKGNRDDKLSFVNDRLSRAKDVLSSYRVELRGVLKEVGKGTYAEYDAKGKEHNTNINKLAAEIEAAKKAAETRELMEGAKKKKKAGEIELEAGGGEVVEEGKRIQTKSALAMDRTAKLVNDMEEMGAETNLQLKSQSEQIKTTHSDVDAINEGMTRASKQVRDIGRRLATDKMIMCMVLLLICMVIGLIVANTLGFNPGEDLFALDCSLDYNKATKKCLEAQSILEEQAAAQGGDGSGIGAGGGGSAAGNSTRREFRETESPFLGGQLLHVRRNVAVSEGAFPVAESVDRVLKRTRGGGEEGIGREGGRRATDSTSPTMLGAQRDAETGVRGADGEGSSSAATSAAFVLWGGAAIAGSREGAGQQSAQSALRRRWTGYS